MLYPAELPGLVCQERDYTRLTLRPQHESPRRQCGGEMNPHG